MLITFSAPGSVPVLKPILFEGRFSTAFNAPMPAQELVLRVDGEEVARTLTGSTGAYSFTHALERAGEAIVDVAWAAPTPWGEVASSPQTVRAFVPVVRIISAPSHLPVLAPATIHVGLTDPATSHWIYGESVHLLVDGVVHSEANPTSLVTVHMPTVGEHEIRFAWARGWSTEHESVSPPITRAVVKPSVAIEVQQNAAIGGAVEARARVYLQESEAPLRFEQVRIDALGGSSAEGLTDHNGYVTLRLPMQGPHLQVQATWLRGEGTAYHVESDIADTQGHVPDTFHGGFGRIMMCNHRQIGNQPYEAICRITQGNSTSGAIYANWHSGSITPVFQGTVAAGDIMLNGGQVIGNITYMARPGAPYHVPQSLIVNLVSYSRDGSWHYEHTLGIPKLSSSQCVLYDITLNVSLVGTDLSAEESGFASICGTDRTL